MRFLRRLVALAVSLSLASSLVPGSGLAATVVQVPFTTPSPAAMRSVTFSDANHGWITGSYSSGGTEVGFILATSDGGASWRQIRTQSGRTFDASALTTSGVGVAASAWVDTTDRFDGSSWSYPAVDPTEARVTEVGGISFANNSIGALVGQRTGLPLSDVLADPPMRGEPAVLYTTSDGGQTWTKAWQGPALPDPTELDPVPSANAQFTDVAFARGTTSGWAIGFDGDGYNQYTAYLVDGITMHTTNGIDWTPGQIGIFKSMSTQPSSIAAVSGSEAWAVAKGAVVGAWAHTINGGASWDGTSTVSGSTKFKPLTDIAVNDAGIVLASSGNGTSAGSIYRKTGAGWAQEYTGTAPLRAITFVDGGSTGWAVGENGTVLKTTDAGDTWMPVAVKLVKTLTYATITTNASIVNYGGSASLTVRLKDSDGVAVTGKSMKIYTSPDKIHWTYWKTVSVATGTTSFPVAPTNKTYYQTRFLGDNDYVAHTSVVAPSVTPKVYLTTPTAPSYTYLGRTFTSVSYLKPKHTTGTYPVKIMCYRYESGKWVYRKYFMAKASNPTGSTSTKCSAAVKLPYRGKWRIRAYHVDALHAATYSSAVRTVIVK